eukprot:SAG11_NODE_10388_length_835_cov_1.754076_1_plen_64_part_00
MVVVLRAGQQVLKNKHFYLKEKMRSKIYDLVLKIDIEFSGALNLVSVVSYLGMPTKFSTSRTR